MRKFSEKIQLQKFITMIHSPEAGLKLEIQGSKRKTSKSLEMKLLYSPEDKDYPITSKEYDTYKQRGISVRALKIMIKIIKHIENSSEEQAQARDIRSEQREFKNLKI
jgi:hypothetical protein